MTDGARKATEKIGDVDEMTFPRKAGEVENDKDTRVPDAHRSLKIVKTTCFVFVWVSMGMMASINGPTIPDLRERLGTTMEQISLVLGFRNIGTPVGSILSGMVSDRYRSKADLVGAIALVFCGLEAILKPYIYNLPALGFIAFIGGVGHGGIDSVGHAGIQWMWADKSGPPMHAIHMGYPIGSTLAPLIAKNFLTTENDTEPMSTQPVPMSTPALHYEYVNNMSMTYDQDNRKYSAPTGNPLHEISKIEIPFGIIGGIGMLMALFLLVTFIYGHVKRVYSSVYGAGKKSMKEVFSPQSFRSIGNTKYTVAIMVLVCIFFAFVSSKDGTMDTFIFSYAIDSELQFTKDEASVLDAVYKASGIFGRLVCFILAKWCPVQPVLVFCTFATTAFTAAIAFVGTDKKVYIWVFAVLFRITASPVWPSTILWASRYISFSSLVVGFIQISASIASFISQWASGYLYDTYGAGAHVYYSMACGFMMVVIMSAMQITASCYRQQKKSEKSETESCHDNQFASTIKLEDTFTRL